MLGAVCHDLGKPPTTAFIDGRIRSIDHEQAGVAPATAVLDRLNIHSIDGYDVRSQVLGIVAHHLKPGMFCKSPTPVSDGAFRRLAQKVDLELLARVAKSDCLGRTGNFDCSAMDWFLERARALGVEHAPPEPLVKGRHLLALGVTPGPRVGADPPADLREAARWIDRDARGRHRARSRDSRASVPDTLVRSCARECIRSFAVLLAVFLIACRDRRWLPRHGRRPGSVSRKICRSAAMSRTRASQFPKFKQDPGVSGGARRRD